MPQSGPTCNPQQFCWRIQVCPDVVDPGKDSGNWLNGVTPDRPSNLIRRAVGSLSCMRLLILAPRFSMHPLKPGSKPGSLADLFRGIWPLDLLKANTRRFAHIANALSTILNRKEPRYSSRSLTTRESCLSLVSSSRSLILRGASCLNVQLWRTRYPHTTPAAPDHRRDHVRGTK